MKWKWTRTYFINDVEVILNRLIYSTFTFFGDADIMRKLYGKLSAEAPVQKYRFHWIDLDKYRKNNCVYELNQTSIDTFYLVWFMN